MSPFQALYYLYYFPPWVTSMLLQAPSSGQASHQHITSAAQFGRTFPALISPPRRPPLLLWLLLWPSEQSLPTSGSLAFRSQSQFSAEPTVTHTHMHAHTRLHWRIFIFHWVNSSQLLMREKPALYCAVLFLLPYVLPGALCNSDAFVTTPASHPQNQHPHVSIY